MPVKNNSFPVARLQEQTLKKSAGAGKTVA
jgi:hypothetical protein